MRAKESLIALDGLDWIGFDDESALDDYWDLIDGFVM